MGWVEPLNISVEQKRLLLDYLKCDETAQQYISLIKWIEKDRFMLLDFRDDYPVTPSELLEEYESIAIAADKLVKLIEGLSGNQELFDQVIRLQQLEPDFSYDKYKMTFGLDDVKLGVEMFSTASKEMRHEIKPKSMKKPEARVTVKSMVQFAKKWSLPCSKRNIPFQSFLSVIFELLNISHDESYERLIRTAHEELKSGT